MKYQNIVPVMRNGRQYFRARLSLPYDPALGLKPPPRDFYGRTKAEAHAKRAQWKPDIAPEGAELLLLDFVRETYLRAESQRAESGRISWGYFDARKRRIAKNLLDPATKEVQVCMLRRVSLGSLRPQYVDEWFQSLHRAKLRQEDLHRCGDDIRAILKMARHYLPQPVDAYLQGVDIPPLPHRIKPTEIFEPNLVLGTITNESLPLADRCLVAFEFVMNCRPSEIFALTWDDIDLDLGIVHFHKRTVGTKEGYQVLAGSKTGAAGMRSWVMGKTLTEMMRAYKEQSPTTKEGWVFTTRRGLPLTNERFKDLWPQIRQSLNLPAGPTFYSLKHAGNSYALAHGVSSQAQAAKMGHTTDRMARETYREILDAEKHSSVDVYQSALAGGKHA